MLERTQSYRVQLAISSYSHVTSMQQDLSFAHTQILNYALNQKLQSACMAFPYKIHEGWITKSDPGALIWLALSLSLPSHYAYMKYTVHATWT